MSNQIILKEGCGQEISLNLIVESYLTNGHENSTCRSCCYAREKVFETLMTIHTDQTIHAVLIAERELER